MIFITREASKTRHTDHTVSEHCNPGIRGFDAQSALVLFVGWTMALAATFW